MIGKFVSIGHITNDTKPTSHLGGGVSYTAVAAARLGYEAHIITKCPKDHPYIKQLQNYGVSVHVLPSKLQTISTHQNVHDESGRKRQHIWDLQEPITLEDFSKFPKSDLYNSQIMLTPVNDEVDVRLSDLLSKYGKVAIEPSGYYRKISSDKTVVAKEWANFNKVKGVDVVILGEQDAAFNKLKSDVHLERLRQYFPIVVYTEGDNGSKVFTRNDTIQVGILPLRKEELIDFAGGGDVYAMAFIHKYAATHDPKSAAVFAAYFSAVKIASLGGIGIDSIPDHSQLEQFIRDHPDEVKMFLSMNKAKEDALSI